MVEARAKKRGCTCRNLWTHSRYRNMRLSATTMQVGGARTAWPSRSPLQLLLSGTRNKRFSMRARQVSWKQKRNGKLSLVNENIHTKCRCTFLVRIHLSQYITFLLFGMLYFDNFLWFVFCFVLLNWTSTLQARTYYLPSRMSFSRFWPTVSSINVSSLNAENTTCSGDMQPRRCHNLINQQYSQTYGHKPHSSKRRGRIK